MHMGAKACHSFITTFITNRMNKKKLKQIAKLMIGTWIQKHGHLYYF